MPNKPRDARFWLSVWLPVLVVIGVIVFESTDWFGAANTSGPLRRLWEAVFGITTNAQWLVIHHHLRKTGHFIGYGTLGLTWLRAWWMTLPHSRFLLDACLALAGTALIASADEWHQTMLPSRTGTPWDVLLDCSGAVTLQLIAYLCLRLSGSRANSELTCGREV